MYNIVHSWPQLRKPLASFGLMCAAIGYVLKEIQCWFLREAFAHYTIGGPGGLNCRELFGVYFRNRAL